MDGRRFLEMSLLARFMYRALMWKERQRARMVQRSFVPGKHSSLASDLGSPPGASAEQQRPAHLETGKRGESLAYWYLRQAGYTIVARNLLSDTRAGELDLVGWDGAVLAFVEVKARSSLDGGQPEAAISWKKQRRVARTAKEYMRRLRRRALAYRFDTISVVWDAESGYQVRLTKDAFKG